VIASNNLAGIRSLSDRRRVAFSKQYHTGLIYAFEALKDHSVTDKGFTGQRFPDCSGLFPATPEISLHLPLL
jgi:hypothetical protein